MIGVTRNLCSHLLGCYGNSIFASWRVLKQVLPLLVGCCVRYKKPLMWAERSADESTSLANFIMPTWFSDWDQGHTQTNILEHSGLFTNYFTFVYICSNGTTHFNKPPPQKNHKRMSQFFEFLKEKAHNTRNVSSLWNCSLQTANN